MTLKIAAICTLLLFLLGCTRSDGTNTFTLESGVVVREVTACQEAQKNGQQDPSVKKIADGYEVAISTFMNCGAGGAKAYLTATNNKRATLVILPTAKESSCECARSVKITLSNRLEPGDTLYVSYDHDVLGHLVVP